MPRPTVPPLARGAPRQLCCILTKPVVMPPPPVLTFSLTLPYLNARRALYTHNTNRQLDATLWNENTTSLCVGPGEMRISEMNFLFPVYLPSRDVSDRARSLLSTPEPRVCFNYKYIYLYLMSACVFTLG